jgi:hypothetical protein
MQQQKGITIQARPVQQPVKKDVFCITCGMKNCPRINTCPRAEIEE